MSQRDLAHRLVNCSYAYISRVEAGMRNPSQQVLDQIARVFDVSPAWLATGQEPKRVLNVGIDLDLLDQCSSKLTGITVTQLTDDERRVLDLELQRAVKDTAVALVGVLAGIRKEGVDVAAT